MLSIEIILSMRGFKTDGRKIQISRSYSYFSGVGLLRGKRERGKGKAKDTPKQTKPTSTPV